jgi:hypothetical protein
MVKFLQVLPFPTEDLIGNTHLLIVSSYTLFKTMITGAKKNAYNGLVGKSRGKRAIERFVRIWENNIKMDLKKIRECGLDPSG